MNWVFLRVWLLLAPVAAFYLPGVAPHEYLDNEKVEIKARAAVVPPPPHHRRRHHTALQPRAHCRSRTHTSYQRRQPNRERPAARPVHRPRRPWPHAVRRPGAHPSLVGQVNKLSSTKTQLPYDYYSLPFCRPAEVVNKMENLGEVLHGSVIKNSAYDISMGKTEFRVLCKRTLEPAEATLLHTRIRQDYRVHMIMDNLPAATKMIRELPDGQTIVMSAPALCPHTSASISPPHLAPPQVRPRLPPRLCRICRAAGLRAGRRLPAQPPAVRD